MAKKLMNDTPDPPKIFDCMTAAQLNEVAMLLPDTDAGAIVRAALKPKMQYQTLLAMLKDNAFSEAVGRLADIRLARALEEHDLNHLSELDTRASIDHAPVGGCSESKTERFLQQCKDRLIELRKDEE